MAQKKQEFRAVRDKSLHNQLRKAAENLSTRKLTRLLNNPRLDVNRTLNAQGTALCIAIQALNKRWFSLLYDRNMRHSYNKCRHFLLTLLHNGAEVNARTIAQNTPLHLLLRVQPYLFFTVGELKNLVALLLEKGADVTATNAMNETPLHVAVLYQGDSLPELLARNPPLYVRDACGYSPLDDAKSDTLYNVITHALCTPPAPHTSEWYALIYNLLRYENCNPKRLDWKTITKKVGINNTRIYQEVIEGYLPHGFFMLGNPNAARNIFSRFIAAIEANQLSTVEEYIENGISPSTNFNRVKDLFREQSDNWHNGIAQGTCSPLSLAYCQQEQNIPLIQLLLDKGGLHEHNGFIALREIYEKGSLELAPWVLMHISASRVKKYWQQGALPFLCCKQVAQLPRDIRKMLCVHYLLEKNKDCTLKLFSKKVRKKDFNIIPFTPLKSHDNARNTAYQLAYEHILDDTFIPHWKKQLNAHIARQQLNKKVINSYEHT